MNIVAKSDYNFHGIDLVPVANQQDVWFTSADLAAALKYKSAKSITNLFNQNADEFTDGMTQVIESVTSGNYRKKVRVFSLRGAHLIAMFARTDIAKEFRRWVLDILDREVEATSVENLRTEFHQRVMLYLDSKGGVIGTHPLTDDQVVMSFDGFVNFIRGKGWLVAPKEDVAKGLIGAIQSLP
ncbi:TPA: Bro-N domain-containing protein [Citrobacter freundii]|uniref:BRO-N domain-containing protein n=1 Tax=Citrobacter freundii TaxID=546 RepID=UPI001A31E85F|nr:Bro-N domain-containing protein [Citrobacter freundii]HAT4016743.1 Bro-N domain-containing protein [Citrobacter freundii]HAT4022574.1 Bro-N domain-containing protein [Citrobacter freundii]HAT4024156.1 Bro-N domain-containing protein [Citrobacter freundii]HAT4035077.1 Bro-N domain-containing protein [Citrobacter freundii]